MKIIYNGPCHKVTVDKIGEFIRGVPTTVDDGIGSTLIKTNVCFTEVEQPKKIKVKKVIENE